jgi:hypothetical protein
MKTAVEQLIEEMKSYSYKVSKEGNLDMVAAFDYAIGIAKKYPIKEKEQIIYAHLEGWSDAYDYIYSDSNQQARQAADYYNETYNQNES